MSSCHCCRCRPTWVSYKLWILIWIHSQPQSPLTPFPSALHTRSDCNDKARVSSILIHSTCPSMLYYLYNNITSILFESATEFTIHEKSKTEGAAIVANIWLDNRTGSYNLCVLSFLFVLFVCFLVKFTCSHVQCSFRLRADIWTLSHVCICGRTSIEFQCMYGNERARDRAKEREGESSRDRHRAHFVFVARSKYLLSCLCDTRILLWPLDEHNVAFEIFGLCNNVISYYYDYYCCFSTVILIIVTIIWEFSIY